MCWLVCAAPFVVVPLPTGLLGVRWLILVLTTLLGVGRQLAVLRLVAVCQLLRRRSPEKHFKESVLASLRRLRCDFVVAWAIDAAARFPLRFCRLGLLGSGRHLLRLRLRHDGRQLNGCGFANLNRDADDRRLVDRTSSGSESLRSLGRPATFGVVSSTSERVGVSGRSRRRFSSSARLSAACRTIAVGQHASPCGQCAGQWCARAIRRAQRQ